jgi:hypothetical protein
MRKAVLLLILLAGCSSFACSGKSRRQAQEEPPASISAPPASEPRSQPAPSRPSRVSHSDVEASIARVFDGVVSLGGGRHQHFLIGDFNGDASEDICMIVNPDKARLHEINSEVANWMIKDPVAGAALLDPNVEVSHAKAAANPLISDRDRLLIAVIHGYGPEGWRNVEARQAYLLKNAVGANLQTQSKKSIQRAYAGKNPFPTIHGDVISQALNGEPGFLYYDGAKYVWYGARSYRNEVAPRAAH